MANSKITWNDKVSLVTDPTIAEINKVTDSNMNEIKDVVNENADQVMLSDTEPTENDNEIWVDTSSNATYMNQEVNIGATNVSNTPTWFKIGKNLVNCNGFTTYTATNITVTPSFTNGQLDYINATKSASSTDTIFVNLTQFTLNLETGTYILNGCPSGGGDSTYSLYFRDNTTNTDVSPRDTGSGASVSLTNGHNYNLYLRIANTSTFTDKKFYPMLRKSTITDDTYEPYIAPEIIINNRSIYNSDSLYGVELYSTTNANAINSFSIKENISHFKYIDVYCVQAGGNARPCVFRYFVFGNQIYVAPIFMGLTTTAHNSLEVRTALLSISGTTATLERNYNLSITAGAVNSTENAVAVIKIIGYK